MCRCHLAYLKELGAVMDEKPSMSFHGCAVAKGPLWGRKPKEGETLTLKRRKEQRHTLHGSGTIFRHMWGNLDKLQHF